MVASRPLPRPAAPGRHGQAGFRHGRPGRHRRLPFAAGRAQGDEDARRLFEERRAILRRCRQVGIEQAFAEKMAVPENLRSLLQAIASLTRPFEMPLRVELCRQALEVFTREAFPNECRQTARHLRNLTFTEQRNWERAVSAYRQPLEAHRVLLGAAFSRRGQQAEAGEI